MLCSLVSIYFNSTQLGIQQEQTVKLLTIDPEICSIFFEKGVGIAFLPQFVYDFSSKMLHSIN